MGVAKVFCYREAMTYSGHATRVTVLYRIRIGIVLSLTRRLITEPSIRLLSDVEHRQCRKGVAESDFYFAGISVIVRAARVNDFETPTI